MEALGQLLRMVGGLQPPFPEYAQDPVGFAAEVLEITTMTRKQQEVLEHVVEHRETNVPAGFNVGKTFLAGGILVPWWVYSVGGLAVTTAPTQRQVQRLLWREVRQVYDKHQARLGGYRTETTLVYSEEAQAWGFTASAHSEESAAGIHSQRLLAIMDESNGVSRAIDNAFRGWLSGAENKGLRIGNPLSAGTPFEDACKRSSIRITSLEHPNVAWAYAPDGHMLPKVAQAIMTQGDDGSPMVKPRSRWPSWCQVQDPIPGAISVEWLEETRADPSTAPGTPYWQARVMGIFPSDGATSLVPRDWFLEAMARYSDNPKKAEKDALAFPWVHGLDVGDGVDDTVAASTRGNLLADVQVRATKGDRRDTSRAIGLVLAMDGGGPSFPEARPGTWRVDYVGVGAGTLDGVLDEGITAQGVHFGSKPPASKQKLQFQDLRAYALWSLRERFEQGKILIGSIPTRARNRLMEELAATEWELDRMGRVKVLPKAETRAKLGRSPDVMDAVAMAFMEKGSKQVKISQWSQ